MKKWMLALLSIVLSCGVGFAAAGCGGKDAMVDSITVITREDGSGTRGAFIELTGVEQQDGEGNKVDKTIKSAEIASSTSVMITNVKNNPSAVGYISLGSLNDSVKAVPFEGVEASVANIKNGTYTLSRPFNIAFKEDNDNATLADFLNYVKSAEAAEIIDSNGYIAPETAQTYVKPASAPTQTLVINGSSSVYPLMQILVQEYCKASGAATSTVSLQFNDSTSGMTGAMNGTYDIGMASRDLKEGESAVLTSYVLATDGIAVIVNKLNPIVNVTKEQICNIYTGSVTKWSEIGVDVNK